MNSILKTIWGNIKTLLVQHTYMYDNTYIQERIIRFVKAMC